MPGRFRRLVRHFLGGFLENDLFMAQGVGLDSALSQTVALILAPGLFYCLLVLFKYGSVPQRMHETLIWEDQVLFVSLAMILIGLLSVVEWDALFPDRRDYYILAPLPVTARLLFISKLAAVVALLGLFWAAANLGPSLLFAPVLVRPADPWYAFARCMFAHAGATFGASAFVFLFFVAVQGILLNLLSPRWFRRASVYVQLAATVVLVFSLLLLPVLLSRTIPWLRAGSPWARALPPFWFVGMYQAMAGRTAPLFSELAGNGCLALAVAGAASALAYAANYRRHFRASLEALEPRRSGPGRLARFAGAAVNRLVLRHPLERACFDFVRLTVQRSRVHRLLLAAWLAVALALSLGTVALIFAFPSRGDPARSLLPLQFVLSFFALCGMRFAFAIPAELRANWAFRAAGTSCAERCTAGVRKAMLVLAVGPVLAVLFPVNVLLGGRALAAAHFLFGAVFGALLVEVLLAGFPKIPFTCSYLPGKANVKALWPVYVAFFLAYAYGLPWLERVLLPNPFAFGAVCLGALAAAAALRRFAPGARLVFEELPEPAVRTLQIG